MVNEFKIIKHDADQIILNQGKGFFSWQENNDTCSDAIKQLLPIFEIEEER